jgi:acyl transferase domain-containing protein
MLLTYMQEENLGAVFGTSVGQDGKSGSLTAPNGPAQQRVILSALENSKISAVEFHIEMHGTGTELGDPIEYGSILQTSPSKYITFSASKTDYGHCETAAGLLSVVNVVQQPRRNSVQQIRHLRFINSYIDRMLENQGSNVFQARQDAPIARHCDQRLLGASSFAFQVRHKILPCLSKMLYETITKIN